MPYRVTELLFVHQLEQPFYSLVYNNEAILPIEVEIQSLRVLAETKVLEKDWMKQRYEQLAWIDDKRARAQYYAQGYQKRIA